jgi:hypothetical protein
MHLKHAPFVASVLAIAMLVAPSAHAQEVSPNFPGQIQITLPSNEQLVGQIQDALPTDDLAVVSDQTNLSVSAGQDLVQQLDSALSVAPDDVSRSRIEGVLAHTEAAVDSLHMAQGETNLDVAHGRLDQARGEAQEALDELRPFVLGLVSTGAIIGK